jgi:hypothetical protein
MPVSPSIITSPLTHTASKGLRLRGGADCLPIDKIRQALDKNKNEEHYIPAEPNPEGKKEASGSNRLCEQVLCALLVLACQWLPCRECIWLPTYSSTCIYNVVCVCVCVCVCVVHIILFRRKG